MILNPDEISAIEYGLSNTKGRNEEEEQARKSALKKIFAFIKNCELNRADAGEFWRSGKANLVDLNAMGAVKSEKKALASRENGKKGGRPRKNDKLPD